MARYTRPRITLTCLQCGSAFEVRDTESHRKFCSRDCSAKFQVAENNPNYGNRWTDEQRKLASEQLSSRYIDNPVLRNKVGSANRGKIFSEERRKKMSEAKVGIQPHSYSEEMRKKVGEASAAKFTDEFKIKYKETMVSRGYWIADCHKSDKEIYYAISNWVSSMWEYITDKKQLELLREKGIFNVFRNKNGVVRDHIYSRNEGFINNVDPILLRHPVNCQLITQSENMSKGKRSDIGLVDLVCKIYTYNGLDWFEQKECLAIIKERYNEFTNPK